MNNATSSWSKLSAMLFIYLFLSSPSFSLLHFRRKVAKEWLWQPCLISLSGNFGFSPSLLRTWCLYILLRVQWEWMEPGLASDLRGRRVLKDGRERVEDGEKEMASEGEWLPCREQAISAGRLKLAFRRLLSKKSGREERLLFTGAETIVGFVVPESSPGVREKGPS